MALGPFARIITQVVVGVVAVLGRAIPKAYGEALQNARKAGVTAENSGSAAVLGKRISRSEALQVLNLTEKEATPEAIQKQYERYFEANDVSKGGSYYLQSKVYRARELLTEYQTEKKMEEKKEREQQQQ